MEKNRRKEAIESWNSHINTTGVIHQPDSFIAGYMSGLESSENEIQALKDDLKNWEVWADKMEKKLLAYQNMVRNETPL